ncbi:MAG: hypothetical protein ACLRMN_00100 [Mediterraneibacter gnavus]
MQADIYGKPCTSLDVEEANHIGCSYFSSFRRRTF